MVMKVRPVHFIWLIALWIAANDQIHDGSSYEKYAKNVWPVFLNEIQL